MGVSKQETGYMGAYVLEGAFSLIAPIGSGLKVALLDIIPGFSLADFVDESSFDDVSTYEISSPNYAAGGHVLEGPPYIYNDAFAAPPEGGFGAYIDFPTLTADIKYAVLYLDGTISGTTNPLLCAWDLDDTGALNVVSPVVETLSITWTAGILAKVTAL